MLLDTLLPEHPCNHNQIIKRRPLTHWYFSQSDANANNGSGSANPSSHPEMCDNPEWHDDSDLDDEDEHRVEHEPDALEGDDDGVFTREILSHTESHIANR